MIATPVKRFDLLWILRMNAGHEPDHFASGHLGVNAFLDDAAARELTEYTGNIAVFRPEILLNTFRVFLRSQIDQDAAVVHDFLIQAVAPEIIQVLMTAAFACISKRYGTTPSSGFTTP